MNFHALLTAGTRKLQSYEEELHFLETSLRRDETTSKETLDMQPLCNFSLASRKTVNLVHVPPILLYVSAFQVLVFVYWSLFMNIQTQFFTPVKSQFRTISVYSYVHIMNANKKNKTPYTLLVPSVKD